MANAYKEMDALIEATPINKPEDADALYDLCVEKFSGQIGCGISEYFWERFNDIHME